jgi:hypothetical protein
VISPRVFTATWCLALLAAPVLWVHGIYVGRVLIPLATSEICTAGPLTAPYSDESLLPVSNVCYYADGSTDELVPGYVNPLLFAVIAAFVLFLVLDMRARHLRRAKARSNDFGASSHERA